MGGSDSHLTAVEDCAADVGCSVAFDGNLSEKSFIN